MEERERAGCDQEGEGGRGESEEVHAMLCGYGGNGAGGGDEYVDVQYAADLFLWQLLGGRWGLSRGTGRKVYVGMGRDGFGGFGYWDHLLLIAKDVKNHLYIDLSSLWNYTETPADTK